MNPLRLDILAILAILFLGILTQVPVAQSADIVETAVDAGTFITLVAAIQAADLVETLKGDGPFTVFAPNDEAFDKLPPGTLDDLLKPENKDTLVSILTYHVVPAKVLAAEVVGLDTADTVNSIPLVIRVEGADVFVNEAKVIQTDIEAANGVIHVIDTVLLPQGATAVEPEGKLTTTWGELKKAR